MSNSSDENSLISRYSLISNVPLAEHNNSTVATAKSFTWFITIPLNTVFFVFSAYFSIIALTSKEPMSSIYFVFLSLSILRVLFFVLRLLFSVTNSDYSYYMLFHLYLGDILLAFISFTVAFKTKLYSRVLDSIFDVFVWVIGWYISTIIFFIGFMLVYLFILERKRNSIKRVFKYRTADFGLETKDSKMCIQCTEAIKNNKQFQEKEVNYLEFSCNHYLHVDCLKNTIGCENCPDCGNIKNNDMIDNMVKLTSVLVEFL